MKIAIISFTNAGSEICRKLTLAFRKMEYICAGYVPERFHQGGEEVEGIYVSEESVGKWTERHFDQEDGLIFVGATGIAVRSIAPCIKDKMTDPAVVVADDQGYHAISLLSGHVGGGNELAILTADILGGEPVITTASDVRGLTAVDVWAKKQGFLIADREMAKKIAAALINGENIGFFSDIFLPGELPNGYTPEQWQSLNVWVTCRNEVKYGRKNGEVLRLIPRKITLGIGCKKGMAYEKIEEAVKNTLEEFHLDIRSVRRIASVDLKKDEQGIVKLAEILGVEFVTFSAEKLDQVPGNFAESEFVRRMIGTGNVCERAAVLGAGPAGKLCIPKQKIQGVTIAAAEE